MKIQILAFAGLLPLASPSAIPPDGQDLTVPRQLVDGAAIELGIPRHSDPVLDARVDYQPTVDYQARDDERGTESVAGDAGEANTLLVEIGNQRQHMGDLRGGAVYDVIYKNLESLCARDPLYPDHCNDKAWQYHNVPIPSNTNRKYQDLEIRIQNSWYGPNDSIKYLLIGTIASVIQQSTEDDKNCKEVSVEYRNSFRQGYTIRKRLCNVPNYVNMRLTYGYHLYVTFTSKPHTGHFDCVAVAGGISAGIQTLVPLYSDALKGPVSPVIDCPNKAVT